MNRKEMQSETSLGPLGLKSIKISVANVEASVAFYKSCLGMKKGTQYNENELELHWMDPQQGAAVVLVHGSDERVLRDYGFVLPRGGSWLLVHVPDVLVIAERLKCEGVGNVDEPMTMKDYGVIMLMVKDPDGNLIQLIQGI